MAASLSVPDMSVLATLMPGRESTVTVHAGQRVMVAVPDPARTSLMISPSAASAVALSTVASGTSSEGLQFPSGIKSPHLLTWDIYGSKVQDPWYLHNLGATDLQVTVIEVVARPAASISSPTQTRSSLQPLKSCLPRFKLPIYPPPPDDIPTPTGGGTCVDASTISAGEVVAVSIGAGELWWKFGATMGPWKLVVNTQLPTSGVESYTVYQGQCFALDQKINFTIGPDQPVVCNGGMGVLLLSDGDAWIRLSSPDPNGVESTFTISPGFC